ncbi:rho GTPase-activating protein 18 isoform X1 [Chiloscyllium plagiosum]|uniref:rho GTPase-activating protein 18 isoform X1 n=2 Tax=Chiloscyllium plagiosum TaxID=36176 RepID=UPI001CB870E7|nr:rho GTPase-activating protein 18 isoform X1 [Chiloscyllium plagiosum]
MDPLPTSQSVVLTGYHLNDASTDDFANSIKEEVGPSSPGRRCGQYSMNQVHSRNMERPQYERSSSQDSLDELSMADYWSEVENIQTTQENCQEEQEEVAVKVPDEGEVEAEWLKNAGLSGLVSGDTQESIAILSTLTRTQAEAVQRRVETFTMTMKKKNKQHFPDVRDIFSPQVSSTHEASAVAAHGDEREDTDEKREGQLDNLTIKDESIQHTDINLEISYSEQAANMKDKLNNENPIRDDDSSLPNYRLPKEKTGTTKAGDLAPQDMKKVRSLALIEITAMYDTLGVDFKHHKAMKIKIRETGLFGVPLSVLLEQDQKKVPGTKVPLILHKLIAHIEEEGLNTEGILRVPGLASRIKSLRVELEAKFYEKNFNWENVRQHDAASILKLFIRELPHPLVTLEYLDAFLAVQNLAHRKHKLQALNLLVLLLPDQNRDTLKSLLEFLQRLIDNKESNKMTLNNISVIMAPNLFMFKGYCSQTQLAMAAGTSNIMRYLIKYQELLWTIPKFIMNQVRQQNIENHKKLSKEKAVMKLLKKMTHDKDRHERNQTDRSLHDPVTLQGVIRVQAPSLSKVSMAIQLTEDLKAGDILARFQQCHNQNRITESTNKEEVCLYEIGGNIGERCLDDDTYMKDLYQLNPNAEWVIKPRCQ